ncbi:hypothetical protein MMC26_003617 [Xylographa opegraphella]|nr:hypothetical protein [Xylographa opegraphella]
MNIFRAPVGCALPFLRSLGNPALQNLRYLSLNVGELDHDDYPVTSADALEFRGSKAAALEQLLSQSHLRCLYLAVEYSLGAKGDGASITYPRWKWVCAFIKRNQSNKLVDEVHVDFLVHEPPSQSFIGRLTSAAKSWHDLPSVLEYKHWRLEGSKDQGSGENIDNFDYNQPLLLYKNVRESPNGTKTHLNIYKFMNSYDWDSDDDTFADWDLHRDSEDDWI